MMSSAPPTPSNHDPQDDTGYHFQCNGTACEFGESYHPGGYHPVHLDDVFNSRYRVIRKLGYGSFSTVWLAVDLQYNRYVALKIAVASFDQLTANNEIALYRELAEMGTRDSRFRYLVSLQDYFVHQGPNGEHGCFVFEHMGPNLISMLHEWPDCQIGEPWERRFPKSFAKRVLREVLLGLEFLHNNGIVHGDLHLGNILVNIRPMAVDAASVESLRTPQSKCYPLRRIDNKADRWAPSYLIQPASLFDYTSLEIDPLVKITDLGGAFLEGLPPTRVITPAALRAPELILNNKFSKGVDIWYLGCLVFELMTGGQLFRVNSLEGDEWDEFSNDDHLIQLWEVIGSLPEDLFAQWRRADKYFGPDGQRLDSGHNDDQEEYNDTPGIDRTDLDGNADASGSTSSISSSGCQSVPLATSEHFLSLEERFRESKLDDIDESEQKQLLQLLHWIFQYDASQCPSTTAILEHPWFLSI